MILSLKIKKHFNGIYLNKLIVMKIILKLFVKIKGYNYNLKDNYFDFIYLAFLLT